MDELTQPGLFVPAVSFASEWSPSVPLAQRPQGVRHGGEDRVADGAHHVVLGARTRLQRHRQVGHQRVRAESPAPAFGQQACLVFGGTGRSHHGGVAPSVAQRPRRNHGFLEGAPQLARE